MLNDLFNYKPLRGVGRTWLCPPVGGMNPYQLARPAHCCCVQDGDGQHLQTSTPTSLQMGSLRLRAVNNVPGVAQQVSGRVGI